MGGIANYFQFLLDHPSTTIHTQWLTKKEKIETENKYEIYQKASAYANALVWRQFWQNYVS